MLQTSLKDKSEQVPPGREKDGSPSLAEGCRLTAAVRSFSHSGPDEMSPLPVKAGTEPWSEFKLYDDDF